MAAEQDHYAILGVDVRATEVELRRAWRRLALELHPDRAGAEATAQFQTISVAYMVLSDPVTRAGYDRKRGIAPMMPAATVASGPPASAPPTPVAMIARVSRTMQQLLACGIARPAEDDIIELLLTPGEAAIGGHITISMRVPVRRAGEGEIVEELFSAWLAVRPGVSNGAILIPSAYLPGMVRPVSFRVRLDWMTPR
jgi:curved DNA-binding protein CbpA